MDLTEVLEKYFSEDATAKIAGAIRSGLPIIINGAQEPTGKTTLFRKLARTVPRSPHCCSEILLRYRTFFTSLYRTDSTDNSARRICKLLHYAVFFEIFQAFECYLGIVKRNVGKWCIIDI